MLQGNKDPLFISDAAVGVAADCVKEDATARAELQRYLTVSDVSALQLDEPKSIGYTLKCAGAAFWALRSGLSFREVRVVFFSVCCVGCVFALAWTSRC